MRRETQKTKHEIYTCTPWFLWEECLFCGLEFRRERGWKFLMRRGFTKWSYSCNSCSSTKEECDRNIDLYSVSRVAARPKAPKSPPPCSGKFLTEYVLPYRVPMPAVKPPRKEE